jgi:hypothetical protein
MAKITMIASKPHSFGMRTIAADEEFEVDNEQQAQTLVSLGRASRKGETTKVQPTTAKPKAEPEDDEPAEKKPRAKAEDAGYSTRRLKAKE